MPIEVIVAALPRTGTLSIKEALEKLGYKKTMHMTSCHADPSLREAWKEIYANHLEKKWTSKDWQHFFEVKFPGYVAGVDSPFSDFAIEIARAYPNAKVILVDRDPDSWLKSYQYLLRPPSYWEAFCLLPIPGFLAHRMFLKPRDKWWQDVYNYPEAGKQVMPIYVNKIKSSIPSEKLLLFKVQDGWKPLCEFLNKDIPEEDFPRTNDHASRDEKFEMRKREGLVIWMRWLTQAAMVAIILSTIVWVYNHKLSFHEHI